MRFGDPRLLWLLVLVPGLVAGYLALQRRRRSYTVRFTNLELLAAVAPHQPRWRRHVAPGIFLVAFVILVGAVARPSISAKIPREQASIMLVVDVSRSMAATDLQPNRMAAAKAAARDFVRSMPASLRVGVVAFSDFATVVAPLSRDHGRIERALADLEPQAGTAMGDGLALALNQIERQRTAGRRVPASILLLSDGQSNRGRPSGAPAQQARDMKVPVYVVGIGTPLGLLEVQGRVIPVTLNEAELRSVAEVTGGSYFDPESSEALREVYRDLGSSLGFQRERREVTALAAGIAAALLVAGAAASLLWFQRIP